MPPKGSETVYVVCPASREIYTNVAVFHYKSQAKDWMEEQKRKNRQFDDRWWKLVQKTVR
jgi:hypothetical protein